MIKDTHETNPSLFKERLALKTTKLYLEDTLFYSSLVEDFYQHVTLQ